MVNAWLLTRRGGLGKVLFNVLTVILKFFQEISKNERLFIFGYWTIKSIPLIGDILLGEIKDIIEAFGSSSRSTLHSKPRAIGKSCGELGYIIWFRTRSQLWKSSMLDWGGLGTSCVSRPAPASTTIASSPRGFNPFFWGGCLLATNKEILALSCVVSLRLFVLECCIYALRSWTFARCIPTTTQRQKSLLKKKEPQPRTVWSLSRLQFLSRYSILILSRTLANIPPVLDGHWCANWEFTLYTGDSATRKCKR